MKRRRSNFRLYMVGTLFVFLSLVLVAQLVRVQFLQHEYWLAKAESQGKVRKNIPPIRGGVFDRKGRPLALSIRSCSVSMRPREVTDRGKVVSVLSKYLSVPKRAVRKHVRSAKPFIYVERQVSLTEKARLEIASLDGIDVEWEADRVYPFGSTAAKIVGFVGHDSKGRAGIEAAFNGAMTGEPGWEKVQRDGVYRSRGYRTYARKKPKNGSHVILTIDAGLQEIAEIELERAAKSTKARAGALIVMDCKNGDILTLAEYPKARSRDARDLVDSLWTVRSFSYIYEPGSTFKLVTAGALLETSKVQSFDVFDGENGKADMGAAVISDVHPHGHLTFREGFVQSSNIVLAKASLNLEASEFYKYIRLFGFGSKTGVRFPGESPGSVAAVKDWSARTQMTMAFGQEIAVTPLQMVNAFAAIANDGVLMAPRIVSAVVDGNGGEITEFEPVKIRNVVSKDTARRLKSFCRSVVEEGTGTSAELGFINVAGKTGTGEKATPRGGYSASKFVASFAGFAPYDDPRIVCLVVLDEPSYANRFGGVSAAPVFARMMTAIANSSDVFDDVLTSQVVEKDVMNDARLYSAPNFLRLDRHRAMERARGLELNVLCQGNGPEVIAQDPDPGVAMEPDQVLRLHMSSDPSRDRRSVPDLRGLPLREAKRKIVTAGLRCKVFGSGVVASQDPSPGSSARSGAVKLYCKQPTEVSHKS